MAEERLTLKIALDNFGQSQADKYSKKVRPYKMAAIYEIWRILVFLTCVQIVNNLELVNKAKKRREKIVLSLW